MRLRLARPKPASTSHRPSTASRSVRRRPLGAQGAVMTGPSRALSSSASSPLTHSGKECGQGKLSQGTARNCGEAILGSISGARWSWL